MRLDDDMRRVVHEQSLGFVATVCPDGTPEPLAQGHDDRVGRRAPGLPAHLLAGHGRQPARNPAIEINVVDRSCEGYRFKGTERSHRGTPTRCSAAVANVAQFLRSEVEGAGGDVSFAPADTEAFEEGTVGWATTNLTITLPDGRHISPRWSAVFHREDGVWMFVQTHASIGVGNEDVGWQYHG